ncbi:MAG: hypothetical protein KJ621_03570, partial [Proteobacteria bacterium]|nr:hypothetical protein [Pseudomonadota bacterium]
HVRITPFRSSVDEGAYLIVANDAFAGHPESSAWTRATFAERATRPWFDPGSGRSAVRRCGSSRCDAVFPGRCLPGRSLSRPARHRDEREVDRSTGDRVKMVFIQRAGGDIRWMW